MQISTSPPTQPYQEPTAGPDWGLQELGDQVAFQSINAARDNLLKTIEDQCARLRPRYKIDPSRQIKLAVNDALYESGLPGDDAEITAAIDAAVEREAEPA